MHPDRVIPARAGNTPRRLATGRSPSTVHPRTGGEHLGVTPASEYITGSSPHGRGTHDRMVMREADQRFIPARAGNTRLPACQGGKHPVHPRTGGEHRSYVPPFPVSDVHPRTGGEHLSPIALGKFRPFIPARAGNTRATSTPASRTSVHPRTGGEHYFATDLAFARAGSSPHGRGTLNRADVMLNIQRFIPARAGNTIGTCTGITDKPVHPRTGGEHRYMALATDLFGGSSPHGRGTLRIHHCRMLTGRFIPARAGNTD